ncbi:TetR family transcriptional regulator [Allosaccharopolyspora coralli]|uniref:TetR family transcriptional regulator n=1 Tax=Allosaccharopolyspora coralli TaxID=2665642 RepID=A0A5Q3QA36_9PSEU|nr:TetR family transcriptional regulator [Allosaccharopolyspora coralli]QGK70044.1 TetR family transcriptional regulator [Allosaccharopolyspora coralli]
MAESVQPVGASRAGRTASGRRRLRSQLAVTALDLFAEHGFEATTVDQIAEAAGVGRRTFFRYFRSKDDVVFPDHDERLAQVVDLLRTADPSRSPVLVVCRTAEVVLDMYLAEPELSLKRFDLSRQVESLRDKEVASVDRYQRVFARFLRERFRDRAEGDLHAAIVAGGVVAAHNQVLRDWLRSRGTVDASGRLRSALDVVRSGWEDGPSPTDVTPHDVVVGVVRTSAEVAVVRERMEHALRDLS